MRGVKKVKIEKNGPYRVSADIPLEKESVVPDADNSPLGWRKDGEIRTEGEYCLCRCGGSRNKPFCDGTHDKIHFDGTETASRESYANRAEITPGPGMDLADVPDLCARARFCHRLGGTWSLTKRSDEPEAKKTAIEQACNCPSGRLIALDKRAGGPVEPRFFPAVSVTQDDTAGVSGPLRLKSGMIKLESADGTAYETRNRQTLCRCGKSRNKPFCDGSHIDIRFSDKD